MKKKTAALAIAAGLMLTLAGCAAGDAHRTQTDTGWVTAQYVKLPDGRRVICVMSDTKISCDWQDAK